MVVGSNLAGSARDDGPDIASLAKWPSPDLARRCSRVLRGTLGLAATGSLALHGFALAATALMIASRNLATDPQTKAAITVFLVSNPAPAPHAGEGKPDAPALPPDFIPLAEPPPPPQFKTANLDLPPPPEPLPPPVLRPLVAPPRQAMPRPTAPPRLPAAAPRTAALAAPAVPPPVASTPARTVPNWDALLMAWLEAHRKYPELARRRGEQGEVTVRFVVGANGIVSEAQVAASSGHASLDAAALATLQGASLPAPGVAATRTIRLRYRLDN